MEKTDIAPTPSRQKKLKLSSLRRLWPLCRPELPLLTIAILALGLGSALNLVFPEIIRRLLLPQHRHLLNTNLWLVAAALLGIFALQGLCFYLRSLWFGVIGQRTTAKIRDLLYAAIMHQPISFFDQARSGELISRINADAAQMQDLLSTKLSVLIRYSFQVVVGIVLMLSLSLKLSLAILITLPLLIGLSFILAKRLRYYSRLQQTELGVACNHAEETFSAARIVKAFDRESSAIERFSLLNNQVLNAGLSRTKLSAFFSSFVSFLLNACIVIVMVYGIFLVNQSQLSAADLTAFLLYGIIVAVSFGFAINAAGESVQAVAASERVFELIENSPLKAIQATPPKSPPSNKIAEGTFCVKFNSVNFSYPARAEIQVLRNISFEIKDSQKIALVGPSGSGKSSIVNLLLRFYDPNSGSILINQRDSRSWDSGELRSCIGYVPQEPTLFAASLAENLRYGKLDASLEQLELVCQQAHILDFINDLPQRFETQVGQRGIQLSTGQKQRLAIARALLRDPKLLILDEATASLDSESEFLIQQAIEKVLQNRSGLMIAHRLSTVKSADLILVIDRGQIVQAGKHAELCQQSGLYRILVERQELGIAL